MSQRRRSHRRPRSHGRSAMGGLLPDVGRWAVASVVLVTIVVSGCAASHQIRPASETTVGESQDQLRKRAEVALETRRAAQAKQLYGTILAQIPEDAEALMGLGEAEVLLHEYGAGLDHSRRAAELAGERADLKARALHNVALALLLTDRTQEAEQTLEAAVELDPTSWRAWNALGRARDARKAWDEAGIAYERALALAPSEGAVLNNFGLSKLGAGDTDGAAELFVRALKASPDLAAAKTNLRLALALGGRYEEALAGVAAEDLPAALNNAGYAALLRGDYAQARTLFLRAIDASPSFYEPAWSNLRFLSSVEERQAPARETP